MTRWRFGYNLTLTFSKMLKKYLLIRLPRILYLLIYDACYIQQKHQILDRQKIKLKVEEKIIKKK